MPAATRQSLQNLSRLLISNASSLSSVLDALGYRVFGREAVLDAVLRSYTNPVKSQDIAEVILVIVLGGDQSPLNVDRLSAALRPLCSQVDWGEAPKYFDTTVYPIRNETDCFNMSQFYLKLSGKPLPASVLLGSWSNKLSQTALLAHCLRTDQIDFADFERQDYSLPAEVVVPKSGSWLCLKLFAVLLEIASTGLSIMVLEIFVVAAASCPECILLGIARSHDPNTGIRAEVLRRLLPLFTGLPGSLSTSPVIMKCLYSVNVDLLVLLVRLAFKRSATIDDLTTIHQHLDSLSADVTKRVEKDGTLDELVGYWGYLAEKYAHAFNLEAKIISLISNDSQACRNLLAYLSAVSNLRNLNSTNAVLSLESFQCLVRCLQAVPTYVLPEELKPLVSVAQSFQRATGDSKASDGFEPDKMFSSSSWQSAFQDSDKPDGLGLFDLEGKPANVSDEVEKAANEYFHRIYTSEISVDDAVTLLKRFKSSDVQRDQETFRCMIHNLFDEYRFFHKYPDKELEVTARLFGALIQQQLVSSITLGIALRYVLEALRKDPEQSVGNEKIFRFGKLALEQFQRRLGEWPQYCSHVVQIPHFSRFCEALNRELQKHVSVFGQGFSRPPESLVPTLRQDQLPTFQQVDNGRSEAFTDDLSASNIDASADLLKLVVDQSTDVAVFEDSSALLEVAVSQLSLDPAKAKRDDLSIIDKLVAVNVDVYSGAAPPDGKRDQILFIVNNIAKDNLQSKVDELRGILTREYYNWFANYLVVKRISTMPNLHPIYLNILDVLESSELSKVILDTTYHNATKLLQSSNITTSSSERSLLRNLGVWLGQLTLSRNRPINLRRMNLKALLMWGYESARLIAVCSFVAKIIEGTKESRVFRPPNPWLMAILGVMRELYDIEDLKMNIKFEVQVLCKNINVRIEDIPRANLLSACKTPLKDGRNPDFTVKPAPAAAPSIQSSPSLTMSTPLPHPPSRIEEDEKQIADGAFAQEQTVIPNLASYVTINQTLPFFVSNPGHRRLVPLAIDRAIREIIQPVVERSVSIATISTKALIMKDFALEPNETQLRNGAHLMISNLAGSLALVTCKEPLRISISNHLRTLLTQANADQASIEQIAQVCSNDNLELGCILIEKASTEKAIRDIDENIVAAVQARRKARESGTAFADLSFTSVKSFSELPEVLRPKQGGLSPLQYSVYEAFQRPRIAPSVINQPQDAPAPGPLSPAPLASSMASAPNVNALSMSQSLEAYQIIFARLDLALKAVQLQAPGRDVTISMLGSEHEILGHFRDMIIITQRTQPSVRSETAMAFCENVFKRLMESMLNSTDSLRLEVFIGMIEALRDACGGAKKFAPDIIGWLSHYAAYVPTEESSRKFYRVILLLLLRAKLLRTQELDVYFATCMDSGRNIAWVEIALLFIRQCLSEGLAATYEFSSSFDTVSKMRPANMVVRKQLQKWLTDLRAIAAPKEEAAKAAVGPPNSALREHVTALLERWLRIWNTTNDQLFAQYLQLMHQYGVLKTEEAADKFFRLSTELCVEACLKTGQAPAQVQADSVPVTTLTFTVIDALSKLFLLLVRLADKEAGDITVRVNLFSRILGAVARTIIEDHDAKKMSKGAAFDQRPYYRLLSNLSQDLGVPDPKSEPNPVLIPLLTSYCQVYLALQPSVLPGFAFSWLQLISHRTFMPHLLLVKGQKCWPFMHRLILALLAFLQPFLKHSQLNDSIRRLYKGTLRVLLVLLHDFPEFLCDFHLSFCDIIPPTCVQLRNLVLSAFPRTMRLPDPFTPNLKVDLLPEINQAPRVLTDYMAPLVERGIRQRIDSFMSNKQPADVPGSLATAVSTGGAFNQPLLTAIVVYVGNQAVTQLQSKTPLQNSPAMEIFRSLINSFDAEGRYYLFNTMANQLRYPNSHTHFFSCVILWLFSEADNEYLQEQITRVLLERLIVHRPHPVCWATYDLLSLLTCCLSHLSFSLYNCSGAS